jgi:hypothetical protein
MAGRTTPPKAKVDFDLDAFERDAVAEPFTFRFGGVVFSLPADPDMRAVGSMATGDVLAALERLLGPEQWSQFEAVPEQFGASRFAALMERYQAHLGVSGEGG